MLGVTSLFHFYMVSPQPSLEKKPTDCVTVSSMQFSSSKDNNIVMALCIVFNFCQQLPLLKTYLLCSVLGNVCTSSVVIITLSVKSLRLKNEGVGAEQ